MTRKFRFSPRQVLLPTLRPLAEIEKATVRLLGEALVNSVNFGKSDSN